MSARLEWREGSSSAKEELKEDDIISMTSKMNRICFEPVRHSVDRSMNLERKVIGYKTRIVSEPIYADELVKNMTMNTCYEAIQTLMAFISQ